MLNVVRRSQIQGLIAMDGSTISHLGEVEEVWLDDAGKVTYLSGSAGYLPLEQVANISNQALSTYGRLLVDAPENLQNLSQRAVHSSMGEPLGWVEDFLFDGRMDRQSRADLLRKRLLALVGARTLELLKPFGDLFMVRLQQLHRIDGAGFRPRAGSGGMLRFVAGRARRAFGLGLLSGCRRHAKFSCR